MRKCSIGHSAQYHQLYLHYTCGLKVKSSVKPNEGIAVLQLRMRSLTHVLVEPGMLKNLKIYSKWGKLIYLVNTP